MSMELYVFSDRPIKSMLEWQEAITVDGFDIKLHGQAVFEDLNGFLPMRLEGAGTGVEVGHTDSAEAIDWFRKDGFPFDHQWSHALWFCWGGDLRELVVAHSTAASYARVTQGVVFDCEEGRILGADEALDLARKLAIEVKDDLGPPLYEWKDADCSDA